MGKFMVVSAKIPEEIYGELVLRVPEGERSNFIRDAIIEKLQGVPRPDKILELEHKISRLEADLSEIKKYLVDLEVLTYERGKINPHTFCVNEIDHKIVDVLILRGGATTAELAEELGTNRWLVLNHLKRLARLSKKQLGKSCFVYRADQQAGRRRAWWLEV